MAIEVLALVMVELLASLLDNRQLAFRIF